MSEIALDMKRRYVFGVVGSQVVAIKAKHHGKIKVKSIFNITDGQVVDQIEVDSKKKNLFLSG